MGRPNLEDALPARYAKSFHPVGRLDADTTGLLLFSAEGQLTQRLLHPSSNVQREYLATVESKTEKEGESGEDSEQITTTINEAELRAKLAAGVATADGTYEGDLVGIEKEKEEKEGGGGGLVGIEKEKEEKEGGGGGRPVVRLCVAEGKHRMVRRMLANAGYPVAELHRVRYGKVELGDLEEGQVKEIDEESEEGKWARALMEGGKGGGGGGGKQE
jgi:23S rRNA pseudouridine2605 synthase